MIHFLLLAASSIGVAETSDLAPFTRIEHRGSIDLQVFVDPSASPKVVLKGDEERIEEIEIESSGGVLTIRTKSNSGWSWWSGKKGQVRGTITLPKLEALATVGSGDVDVKGLDGADFELRSTGSGDVTLRGRIGDLDVKTSGSGDFEARDLASSRVRIRAPGSGDVELAGTADLVKIDLMGSGDVDAGDLVVQERLDVSIMGSGDVTICARGEVDKSTMGSGDVRIRCD
ncbi:MAG: head GIN domain-containing protein [Myxococcota bacterium]